jgi:hypothetical protein
MGAYNFQQTVCCRLYSYCILLVNRLVLYRPCRRHRQWIFRLTGKKIIWHYWLCCSFVCLYIKTFFLICLQERKRFWQRSSNIIALYGPLGGPIKTLNWTRGDADEHFSCCFFFSLYIIILLRILFVFNCLALLWIYYYIRKCVKRDFEWASYQIQYIKYEREEQCNVVY